MKQIIAGITSGILFLGLVMLVFGGFNGGVDGGGGDNVSMVDGKQIIKIKAKGGYFPRNTVAKADVPTILKVETSGTFDCSASLVIPALNYQESLPFSGVKEVDLKTPKKGSSIQGFCSMGMYNFEVEFT